jgi:hypothetical protein
MVYLNDGGHRLVVLSVLVEGDVAEEGGEGFLLDRADHALHAIVLVVSAVEGAVEDDRWVPLHAGRKSNEGNDRLMELEHEGDVAGIDVEGKGFSQTSARQLPDCPISGAAHLRVCEVASNKGVHQSIREHIPRC